MPKWGVFNASLLLNEHGHPPFLFQNWSYRMTNLRWTKFEQKSIVTFISEELPYVNVTTFFQIKPSTGKIAINLSWVHQLLTS